MDKTGAHPYFFLKGHIHQEVYNEQYLCTMVNSHLIAFITN